MQAHTIKMRKCIIVLFDFKHSSAVARTFGKTERRLVICIDFTVALTLRVIAVGDGDIFVLFFVNVDRFEKVNVIFYHVTCVQGCLI